MTKFDRGKALPVEMFRAIQENHFYHHFGDPGANHGVTSPIWDMVFGTWQAPGRIRVPVKLQMCWLVEPRTGDVCEDLAAHYQLVRRAA